MTVLIHPSREKYNMKQNVFVSHVDSGSIRPRGFHENRGKGYLGDFLVDICHPEIGPCLRRMFHSP